MSTYIKKLLKLSPGEFRARTQKMLYRYCERLTYTRHVHPMADEALFARLRLPVSHQTSEMLHTYFCTRTEPHFFLDQQPADVLRTLIHKRFPDMLPSTRKATEAVMRHEFAFLGIEVRYGAQIPWHADPVSGREWPRVFYADIDIAGGDIGYGDIKYVWELNRHQYFVDLGRTYWLTGERECADEFMRLFASWVAENPYNTGVNWTSTLEHAFRALSWIWAYYYCRDVLTPEFHVLFLKTLYQHAYYISKHLSFYHSPYNHLIGEATALFFIGALFPEFSSAKQWAALGWQVLDSEVDRQFHADGFTVEQASFYHHATLGFYLLAVLLRKLNNWPVRSAVWERLERAIDISVHLTHPNGRVPRIGDVDDARPVRLAYRALWDFREFHAMGAVLFDRPDFKYVAGEYTEEALWLLGVEGYKRFVALEAKPPKETSKSFAKSGYYMMRTGWERDAHWLCFDCGEQSAGLYPGATPSAAHGHGDALSILLAAFGEPMLVDGGLYTYFGDKTWRDYFRETRAHNTVVVDGENQSLHGGGLVWSHVARTTWEEWITTPRFDYVCGTHDGYRRLASPVLHRRAVFFRKPDYWLLFDELQGEGKHSIESYFHLAPSSVERQMHGLMVHFVSGHSLYLSPIGVPLSIDTIESSEPEHPESGWIGTSYGCRVPAPVIRWHATLTLPVRWCTLLTFDAEAWRLECHEGVFSVHGRDCTDRYMWQPSGERAATGTLQGIETNLTGLRFVLEQEAIQYSQ